MDGDITSQITYVGTVNTSTPGVYTITYSVTDAAGNRADNKTRQVTIETNCSEPLILANNGVTIQAASCATPGETYRFRGADYYVAKNSADLKNKIRSGHDPARIVTTHVTDMSQLFAGNVRLYADISHWDTSNVTNMYRMFHNARTFNGRIEYWDVSKVSYFHGMFE